MSPTTTRPGVAKVDFVVDDDGNPVEVADDTTLEVATGAEQTMGASGPTNWWRLGLAGLAVLIALVLVLRFAGGNTATDVVPGTPVAAPQTEQTGK